VSNHGENIIKSDSGIPLKTVYTQEDVQDINVEKEIGYPGREPFLRGIHENMYRGKLWTIRQFTGYNTPEETNERFRYEHENGSTGFSIAFDAPTENGLDADDPNVADDVGMVGVSCCTLRDMEVMFEGLPIDKVSTAVIASPFSACALTAMYFVLAEKRGIDIKKLMGTSQNDLLLFTACCHLPAIIPPRHLIRLCVDLVEWCAQNTPKWHPVSIASYNYRENGLNAWQEVGLLFANAITYIEEELKRNRLKVDEFVPTMSFHMASHSDFFEEVAKFRAARRIWCKLTKERYKAENPKSLMLRFHVQTSGSTLTYQQPLNNLIRVAYQVLAAALGGVQSLHANSYDEGICLPTEQGILLSLRTQQIAQFETGITRVSDPLGGSYYLEHLTNEIEKRIWDYMKKIEVNGGLINCLESGWIHQESFDAMNKYQNQIKTGERKAVGVNCFELEEEPYQVPYFRPDPATAQRQKEKLENIRKTRDNQQVENALLDLKNATIDGENVMPAVIRAVKEYATLGEICDVWRDIYSIWEIPVGTNRF
jgi:methylmalonyl-CoA mutase N-terminal domain/subunit